MTSRDWAAGAIALLRSEVDGVAPVRRLPSPYFTVDVMRRDAVSGTIATVFADAGDQYAATFHDPDWVAERGFDVAKYVERIDALYSH